MRIASLFTVGLFALSAQADLVTIRDLGSGVFTTTTMSSRVSITQGPGSRSVTITAPSGMIFWDGTIQDTPTPITVYSDSQFVSDEMVMEPTPIGSTRVTVDVSSSYGFPYTCAFGPCSFRSPTEFDGTLTWISLDTGDRVTDEINFQYIGPAPTANISGWVFSDRPGYSAHPGLAGETVELLNPSIAYPLLTTTTGADGSYSFTGLPAGSYEVVNPVPNGVTQTFTGTDPTSIRVDWDQSVSNVNFGDGFLGTGYIPEPASVWLLFAILFPIAVRQFYAWRKHRLFCASLETNDSETLAYATTSNICVDNLGHRCVGRSDKFTVQGRHRCRDGQYNLHDWKCTL